MLTGRSATGARAAQSALHRAHDGQQRRHLRPLSGRGLAAAVRAQAAVSARNPQMEIETWTFRIQCALALATRGMQRCVRTSCVVSPSLICACLRASGGGPRNCAAKTSPLSRPRACGASARGAAAWRDGAAPRRARWRRGARPRVRAAAPPRRSSQRHRRRRRRPRRPRASAAAAAGRRGRSGGRSGQARPLHRWASSRHRTSAAPGAPLSQAL